MQVNFTYSAQKDYSICDFHTTKRAQENSSPLPRLSVSTIEHVYKKRKKKKQLRLHKNRDKLSNTTRKVPDREGVEYYMIKF